jgi:hypothetical protein
MLYSPAYAPVSSPYAVFRAEDWPSLLQPVCAAPVRGHPQASGPCSGSVLVQGDLFEFLPPRLASVETNMRGLRHADELGQWRLN